MWLSLYYEYFYHPLTKWLTWLIFALWTYNFIHKLAVTHSIASASWTLLNSLPHGLLVLMFLSLFNKMPTPTSPRVCFATIDAVGLQCLVPEKRYTFSWKKVISVRQTMDYLLFFSLGSCFAIPKRAFEEPDEAQAYFETARYYKQMAKHGQPPAESKEDEVWPPPPRIGA